MVKEMLGTAWAIKSPQHQTVTLTVRQAYTAPFVRGGAELKVITELLVTVSPVARLTVYPQVKKRKWLTLLKESSGRS